MVVWQCVGGWAVAADEADEAKKAWRELFAQANPPGAMKQIRGVLRAVEYDVGKLKALIASDGAYRALKPGWHKAAVRVAAGERTAEVEFVLRVPKGYSPAKSYPLVLAAHGQGGSGEEMGRSTEVLLGKAVEAYLIVAPTLPDKDRGFLATG